MAADRAADLGREASHAAARREEPGEAGMAHDTAYLMAGQASEYERLRLQSRVWEPAGERLLAALGPGDGCRVLELGCGPMGWLGLLSRWVGAAGEVVGTDVDEATLAAARAFCAEEALVAEDELDQLVEAARAELAAPGRWGTTFTLVQAWGRAPPGVTARRSSSRASTSSVCGASRSCGAGSTPSWCGMWAGSTPRSRA